MPNKKRVSDFLWNAGEVAAYVLTAVGFSIAVAALLAIWANAVIGPGLTDDPARSLELFLTVLNVLAVAGLLMVTLGYANSTREIAQATREQAEVSRTQSAQFFRPILTIEGDGSESFKGIEHIAYGLKQQDGVLPDFATFRVRNVGVGPALNVRWESFDRNRIVPDSQHQFVLARDRALSTDGEVIAFQLMEHEKGTAQISILHEDVSGRKWESLHEAPITRENLNFGELRPQPTMTEERE